MKGFEPEKLEEINKSGEILKQQLENLLIDIKKSSRPVLLIGGGVKIADVTEDLHEIGELLKIPMYPTWNALDVVTSDYKYYCGRVGTYGGAGRNFGIQMQTS